MFERREGQIAQKKSQLWYEIRMAMESSLVRRFDGGVVKGYGTGVDGKREEGREDGRHWEARLRN